MSSTEPSKLYPALLAAMGDFGAVVKNKQNPHLKNYYADLGAVLDAVTEPLAKHGLLIVQRFGHDQGGPILITEIVHAESGQSIASELPIVSKDPTDPQKFGGAITYARRYSLLAILSLTAEDDDGNSAAQPATPRQQPRSAPVAPVADNRPTPAPPAASNGNHVKYNDPRHTTTYAPQQALRAEVAARQAEPLTVAAFDKLIEDCWTLMENGKALDTIKADLNAERPRMSKEQRVVAIQQLAAIETAINERDAATAPAVPPASYAG